MLYDNRYEHLLCSLALFLFIAAPVPATADNRLAATEEPSTESLFKKLQTGGLVVFLRHATTDRTQVDRDRNDLSNRLSQRNLSAEGRDQARAIGDGIRALNIPVGTVITSPYCRCKDTAQLAFGTSKVSNDLRFGLGDDMKQTAYLSQALTTLLSTPPSPGTNTVLVSHTANLKEAAGIWPKPEGAAYVFKPLPGQDFEYLGRIPPDAWGLQSAVPPVTSSSLK